MEQMEFGLAMAALIGLAAILFIPCLIITFWRSRPRLAMFTACLVLFLTFALSGIIQTSQAETTFGNGASEMIAGAISEAIISAVLAMVIFVPILFLFRWIIRKIFPDKVKMKNVFE